MLESEVRILLKNEASVMAADDFFTVKISEIRQNNDSRAGREIEVGVTQVTAVFQNFLQFYNSFGRFDVTIITLCNFQPIECILSLLLVFKNHRIPTCNFH